MLQRVFRAISRFLLLSFYKKKVTKEKLSIYCHDDDSETLRQEGAIRSRAVAARLLSRRTRRTAFSGLRKLSLFGVRLRRTFLGFYSHSSFDEALRLLISYLYRGKSLFSDLLICDLCWDF